jgi:(1->4)-alpha-D-glucan 1-alpha-D-glucosylmutase
MNPNGSPDMVATYRFQLGLGLTFERAAELLPYLGQLGISHLYLSPCLQAAAGSTHGYDVVDPGQVSAQLGGLQGFETLCRSAAQAGIGLLLDIVPNHMAADRQNRLWWDVLACGQGSRYAEFFDIRWDHPDPLLAGKVLLPVLGDEIERCLALGQIQIRRSGTEIFLAYFEHQWPLSSACLHDILHAAGLSGESRPLSDLDDADAAALDETIAAINADPPRLKGFLDRQHYRLGFWRHANRSLNYRRFFDIHHLVGVCVEKEAIFAATHALVLGWVNEGRVAGLRIDHPDGLRDPTAYLKRLRAAAPRAWILVEKILEPGETLAPQWPVDGTTGYDFLNLVGGLFVDPKSERLLTDFYGQFSGQPTDYRAVVEAKKRLVLDLLFDSELCRLVDLLMEGHGRRPGASPLQRQEARLALSQLIACFPVYRTYLQPPTGRVEARDRTLVREALQAAMGRQPDIACDVWRLIEDLLLLRVGGQRQAEFVWRFQQLTGPVMAKGVEDTAFYNFNRLICLNEVGGNPQAFGTAPEALHQFCRRIQSQWPRTLLASATHDTKRGEDTRIRIALLSEIPRRWIEAVKRWSAMNARFRRNGFPDPNTEYFFYQTLAGAWPIGWDRLWPTLLKAAKEAKVHTCWTDPDPVFEDALRGFVEAVLGDSDFTADLAAFLEPLAWPAAVSSLSQTLIKCTAPGVPDTYQGAELWDHNLVDPDNRRPVDFEHRRRLLAEVGRLGLDEILNRHAEGLPKLFVLQRALSVRRRFPQAFGPFGDYRPLAAKGSRAGHLVAFMRGRQAVTLAPRLVIGLSGDWKDTAVELPAGTWQNVFSAERLQGGPQNLSRILARFPVALLVRKGGIR